MSGVSQSIRYTAQNLGNMADQIVKQITDKIEWLYMNIIDGILSFRRYLADGLAYIGDQVRASIAAFTVTIRRAINGMIDRVMEGLGGINERVRITAANTINQVHAASRGIQTYLNNTFMWFKRDLLGGIGAQVTALAQGGMNFVQQALTGVSRALGEGLQDLFEWLWKGATDTAARIVSFLSEDILAPIAAGLEGTAKWFGTIMDTGIEQVFELLEEPVGDEEDAAQAKAIKLLKLAGGISIPFAMSILAGELVHPLKSLGLGQVAAIAYDVGGFGVIARDIVKVVTEVSAIIPLRVALMEKAVPMVPFEEQLIQLASKRVMPQEDFTRMMRKSGFNEYWSDLFWETSWFKPRFPELQV
ncbi:MAG: hypothetical protein KAT00_15430, partial [Planctomycetes bacterium]|nr:hypothetical protein [Planctomycetota bacterium]